MAAEAEFEPILRVLMRTMFDCPDCQLALTHIGDHFTELMKEVIQRPPL